MQFPVHTVDTAPVASRDTLAEVAKLYGFTPNLLAVMADAPSSLKAYLQLNQLMSETSFTATERQIVLMTTSYENNCDYCMAAHSGIAAMQGVPEDVIASLRDATTMPDAKLDALRKFTAIVVESRGFPSDKDLQEFENAGYTRSQVLEVVLGVALKTLSNYTNHVAKTPVDSAFSEVTWEKAS